MYSLKLVGKSNKIVDRRSVKAAAGKFVGPETIKAQPDVMYHLSAEKNARALDTLVAKRVDDDLHISLLDGDINTPDLIIQNYFAFNSAISLVSTNLDGELVEFSNTTSGLFSSSQFEADQAAGVSTMIAEGVAPPWYTTTAGQLDILGGALLLNALTKSSSSAAASTDATQGLGKIEAYANDAKKAAPLLSDYTKADITGVDSINLDPINTAVLASKATTKEAIQKIVVTYSKVLAEANGAGKDVTPDSDPSAEDYKTLGVNARGAASDPKQLSLLNEILKNRSVSEANTVTKLDALAKVVDSIFSAAKLGLGNDVSITAAEYSALGIYDTSPGAADKKALTAEQTRALTDAIKANGPGKSETFGQIDAIKNAYQKILIQADGKKLNTVDADMASAADFKAIGATEGLALGTAANKTPALKLLNTSIDALSADKVDTLDEINKINKTVDKVMQLAAITGADQTAIDSQITAVKLTATELGLLGVTGVTADNVKFLASAVQATGTNNNLAKVDELKEIQGLVDLAVVMAFADTSTAYASADARRIPAHTAPAAIANYVSAGVVEKDEGASKAITNLAAINSAVNAVADPALVNTATKLQALVNTYDKLLKMADGGAEKDNTLLANRMTQVDYRNLGALNYSATGALLDPSKFSTSVSKAAKAAPVAATTASPTINDVALNLLNNIVDNLPSSQVDSVEKINALSLTLDKVLTIASGDSDLGSTGIADARPLTASDLSGLGLTALSNNQAAYLKRVVKGLDAAIKAPAADVSDLTATPDYTKIDTLKELQSAIDLGVIMAYANTSPNISPAPETVQHIAPGLASYTSFGVPATSTALAKQIKNVSAINSAVEALADGSKVDTLHEVQNIVNIYDRVLSMADGSRISGGLTPANGAATASALATGKLTAVEYQAIGALAYNSAGFYTTTTKASPIANNGSATTVAALNLLNDLIDGLSSDRVDTIGEINGLSQLVDKVMDAADGDAGSAPSKSLTPADLSNLGLNSIPSTDSKFLTTLESNIVNTSNDGSQVDTVQELQAWVTWTAVQRYAQLDGQSSAGALSPNLTSYQNLEDSGILGRTTASVTWTNDLTTAVNSALVPLDASAVTTGKFNNISLSYRNILNETRDGSTSGDSALNPTSEDYINIGVNLSQLINTPGSRDSAVSLLNDVVRNKTPGQIGNVNTLTKFAEVINKIQDLAELNVTGTWTTATTLTTSLTKTEFESLDLSFVKSDGNSFTPDQYSRFLFQIAKGNGGDTYTEFDTLNAFKALLVSSAVLNG